MELSITIKQPHRRDELFGPGDRHLRKIRDATGVKIHTRSGTLQLSGEPANVARAAAVLEKLQDELQRANALPEDYVEDTIADSLSPDERDPPTGGATAANGGAPSAAADQPNLRDRISVFTRGADVVPKTEGQRQYFSAMRSNDLVFCLGPAGTGKTYMAVAMAVHRLKVGQTKRIALVRPAVEAGERLGFLPGDLQAKVNPYLRPIFDALLDMMTSDQMKRFMAADIIEVIPLAYMRGRTLTNATIILDEAQNTTPSQMLMFLTRLGIGSRMIVTGDDSQVDLEPGQPSGLQDAVSRLNDVRGIEIVRLSFVDIVRHALVQEVVNRYSAQPVEETRLRRR